MATWLNKAQSGLFGQPQGYGLLSDEELQGAQRSGMVDFGASLLASSGPSYMPTSIGQGLGQAILQGRQGQGNAIQQALNAALLKKQMMSLDQRTTTPRRPVAVIGPDGKPVYVSEAEAVGKEPYSPVQRAEAPAVLQEYSQYVNDETKAKRVPKAYMDWLPERAKSNVGTPYTPMTVGGAVGFGDRASGSFTPVSTLKDEAAAAAAIKAEQERAASLAKEQATRDATFETDINVISDEIERTERLLDEFNSGKYQTGPIAGRLPNMRTSAQDLAREQGKDTIKAISSATFGALSEGERSFLKDLGVSEAANEESNINMLRERKRVLTRAKDRLLRRPPLIGDDRKESDEKKPETWEEGDYMYRKLPDGTVQRKKK